MKEETRIKMSIAMLGNTFGFKKGNIPWNTGKKRPEMTGEKNWNWKGGIKKIVRGYKNSPILKCQYCNKEYSLPYRIPKKELLKRKFCDRKCFKLSKIFTHNKPHSIETKQLISKLYKGKRHSPNTEFKKGIIPWNKGIEFWQVKGERNNNWQGGKSLELYPLGWNNTFREQIRHRDGYKCQLCGVHEVECNTKLSVHHIDYDKFNLSPENLITLCVSCHVKTNSNREKWIKIFKNKENYICEMK